VGYCGPTPRQELLRRGGSESQATASQPFEQWIVARLEARAKFPKVWAAHGRTLSIVSPCFGQIGLECGAGQVTLD
jgi:hypothetical protein